MIVEDFLSFTDWLLPGPAHTGNIKIGAFFLFWILAFAVFIIGSIVCYLYAAVRHGFTEGFYVVARTVGGFWVDMRHMSVRRIWAVARLAIQESIRRKVVIVFVIFMIILLFASWFLDVESENPAKLYLSFVLTTANFFVLGLAILLATFSLPSDIKNRTIYSVVTKPVRAIELVLGRILGFGAVGTVLIVVMCVVGYFFVTRGVHHDHIVETFSLVDGNDGTAWTGVTSYDSHHSHQFEVPVNGVGRTDVVHGHWHEVRHTGGSEDAPTFEVGAPQDMLQSRVPEYGSLRFLTRSGVAIRGGISIGDEFDYRSYISGGTLSSAIWTFSNVTREKYQDGLPLELGLQVFRTNKGEQDKGVLGTITIQNPDEDKGQESAPIYFEAREFEIDQLRVPIELDIVRSDGSSHRGNLFEDLVNDRNEVKIKLQCSERNQYYGVSRADLYIRADNTSFGFNFIKGHLGIWFQMVLATCFGVMFSTFLNTAVSMLAAFGSLLMGFFSSNIHSVLIGQFDPIATDATFGGGPIEAFVRVVTQKNVALSVDLTLSSQIIDKLDKVLMIVLTGVAKFLLPDYRSFNTSDYVAYGYSIDPNLIARHATITLVYLLGASIVGYFFLKTREIAA